MKRLVHALLLRDFLKPKPWHLVPVLLFLAYQCWMASPYVMYYIVGEPAPGTALRYVGKLRVEGELRRTGSGWAPPRYLLETITGEVEFHCGYLPYKRECLGFFGRAPQGLDPVEVGMDGYWGVDFIKFPAPYAHFNEYFEPSSIRFRREIHLHGYTDSVEPIVRQQLKRSVHFWALFWLCVAAAVYLLLVCYGLLPDGTAEPAEQAEKKAR